jgi:hypothetical protein
MGKLQHAINRDETFSLIVLLDADDYDAIACICCIGPAHQHARRTRSSYGETFSIRQGWRENLGAGPDARPERLPLTLIRGWFLMPSLLILFVQEEYASQE